jgi:hypothetical protein
MHIAEVQYFFRVRSPQDDTQTHVLAVLSDWSAHDEEIWRDSYSTVWFSRYQGQRALRVIEVKATDSCVAMLPHTLRGKTGHFLVEKPGLGVLDKNGYEEPENRRDEDIDMDEDAEDV